METTLRRLFIAAVAAGVCSGAYAQSSVTVYGRIDVSANWLKFDSTATKPSSTLKLLTSDASLLGFSGTEDLGGGSRAYFKLEHGYQLDTGSQTSPTTFWNRETYVGLGNASAGSVQLGSQWGPAVVLSARTDAFGRLGEGALVNPFQGARGYTLQYQNAIQYLSPRFEGFGGKFLVSAGEGAVTGHSSAGQIDYSSGPALVGLAVDRIKVVAASVGLVGAPVASTTVFMGAAYDFKVVRLNAWYQTNRIDNLANVNGYAVGATVPFGASMLRVQVARRTQANAGGTLVAVGYDYNLSKRSLVYARLAQQVNDGSSAIGLGPSAREAAALGLPAAGQDVRGLQLGVRHSF